MAWAKSGQEAFSGHSWALISENPLYIHPKPVLALLGVVSHLPLTQGDEVGATVELLLTDPE